MVHGTGIIFLDRRSSTQLTTYFHASIVCAEYVWYDHYLGNLIQRSCNNTAIKK